MIFRYPIVPNRTVLVTKKLRRRIAWNALERIATGVAIHFDAIVERFESARAMTQVSLREKKKKKEKTEDTK